MKPGTWTILGLILAAIGVGGEYLMFGSTKAGKTVAVEDVTVHRAIAKPQTEGVQSSQVSIPIEKSAARSESYSSAINLMDYLAAMQPGASAQDVALAKAKAMAECRTFAARPNYAAEVIQQHQGLERVDISVIKRYVAILSERCRNLESGEPADSEAVVSTYKTAADGGNREALAHRLARDAVHALIASDPGKFSVTDFKVNALDLLASGDPEAIFELSGALGPNSLLSGAAAGSDTANAAWELVACDLGMDCSEGSPIMRGFCLNGGIYCFSGNLRDNLRTQGFAPAEFERVEKLEATIYRALKQNTLAQLFN